jgi:hypothetical protein
MEDLIFKLNFILGSLQQTMDNLIDNYIVNYTSYKQKYNNIYYKNKKIITLSPILLSYCRQIDNLILIGDLILEDIKNEFKIKY